MKNFAYAIALIILSGAIIACVYATTVLDAPAQYACAGAAGLFASVLIGSLCLRLLLQERQPPGLGDPGATVVISQSKGGSIVIAAMFAAAAGSLYLIGRSEVVNPALIWIGCFASIAVALVSLLGARSAWLRLSPSGLEYTPFRGGPISWSDIVGASVVELGKPLVVALEIRDVHRYKERGLFRDPMLLAERCVARTPFLLPAKMLRLAPTMLVDAVYCRIRAFGAPIVADRGEQALIKDTLS